MGMFDSVIVSCPKCKAEIEFQSKAGVCELKRYHQSNVPATVAESLNGGTKTCPFCQCEVEIVVCVPRVALSAKVMGTEQEYD